jgi:hypothetical protein
MASAAVVALMGITSRSTATTHARASEQSVKFVAMRTGLLNLLDDTAQQEIEAGNGR